MFFLYSILYTIGFILMSPIFLLKRKKYLSGFRQRFGYFPRLEASEKEVVWIHCVSVGETNAARPLIEKIHERYPHLRIVISTTTKTGQELAKKLFSDIAELVFYFPFDFKLSVRRALRRIKPRTILIMETEIWFNFLRESYKSDARIVLINGRLSKKSVKGYSWIRKTMKRVLHYVDIVLVQHHIDSKRFIQLGLNSSKIKVTGNMKFDQDFNETESELTKEFRNRFKINENAPLIVAASTHEPEEKLLLDAFKELWKKSNDELPRLLIAPRHPERFDEVEQIVRQTGFDWVRRTEKESSRDAVAEVIILDSIGELREVFPLAEVVFVGGSLIPHGGQSFLEPAGYKKAIVTGFYTMNFEQMANSFIKREALIKLPKLSEKKASAKLVEVFEDLLNDKEKREKMGEKAFNVVSKNRGATEKTLEHIHTYLKSRPKPVSTPIKS